MKITINRNGQPITENESALIGIVLELYHLTTLQNNMLQTLSDIVLSMKGTTRDGADPAGVKAGTEASLAMVREYARGKFPQFTFTIVDD